VLTRAEPIRVIPLRWTVFGNETTNGQVATITLTSQYKGTWCAVLSSDGRACDFVIPLGESVLKRESVTAHEHPARDMRALGNQVFASEETGTKSLAVTVNCDT
jgi:hypothetical protein